MYILFLSLFSKIDDLRKIINRIAYEGLLNKSIENIKKEYENRNQREDCFSGSSYLIERDMSNSTTSTGQDAEIFSGDTEEEYIEGAFIHYKTQHDIQRNYGLINNNDSQKHLFDCLLFWKDIIYNENYK